MTVTFTEENKAAADPAPVTWLEVKPLGHILRDEYARLVVKNEATIAERLAAANHVEGK